LRIEGLKGSRGTRHKGVRHKTRGVRGKARGESEIRCPIFDIRIYYYLNPIYFLTANQNGWQQKKGNAGAMFGL